MGYIGFTIFIAASGALIVWFWHRSCTADRYGRFGRYRQYKNGLQDDPIPPVKPVVGGLSEPERQRIELEGKLDSWQRAFEMRKARLNNVSSLEGLEGRKYTFVPGPRRSNSAASSA